MAARAYMYKGPERADQRHSRGCPALARKCHLADTEPSRQRPDHPDLDAPLHSKIRGDNRAYRRLRARPYPVIRPRSVTAVAGGGLAGEA